MSLLLIDDQGDVWDGQSRQLRQSFDSPYSGGEFSDYAVANLGFIALNVYGGSCQLRLRPELVSERTYRALLEWLAHSNNERIVLTWLGDSWANELLRTGPNCLRRLDELVSNAQRAKPNDFLSRRLTPAELPEGSPFREILENWAALGGPRGQPALMHLIQMSLGQRHLMVKPEAGAGKLVFHSFGTDLFADYDTWRTCAVGAPMEEMPDRSYGRLVAPSYYETLAENAPRVEEVDAIIRWPRNGRSRLRYKRLIVPLKHQDGSPLLVGGSVLDHRVDLRIGRV